MPGRPVAGYQLDLPGVELVEGRVVEDQQPAVGVDHGPGLLPERGGVGLEAMEQPGEGVVGRGIGRLRLHGGGLGAGECPGRGDEEIDGVGVETLGLWGVHATHHGRPSEPAQYGRPITTA
jgi:hypothetical protein